MPLSIYSTGTVSVPNGGTVVTLVGGLWTAPNAAQGDWIAIDGLTPVLMTEITDSLHAKIPAWLGATKTAVNYVIYQNFVARVVGVAAAEAVGNMLAALRSLGPVFNVPPADSVPDPSYGADGQYAFQITTGKLWVKAAGVWGLTTAPLLGSFTQAETGAVARSIVDKLTDVLSVVDFGAATTNTAAQNTTAIQAALNTGKAVYLPPGLWPCNTVTISNSKTKFFGASASQSVLTSAQTNAAIINVAANIGNIEIHDLGLTRSVTATAGGTGLNFLGYVDTSKVRDLEVQKQYVGIGLSSTGYSELSGCFIHDNIADGVELINTAGNGNLQWYLKHNLVQGNGLRGYIAIAAAGPAQVTLGDWTNNHTFANSSFGMAFIGLAGVPIHGVRINGGFVGGDGNSEIFLDTYGGQHKIENVFTELAGSVATGPLFATAASHIGSGVEITANNIDVTITDHVANGNSVHGIRTLATQITNITSGRFANNSLFGVLIGDGSKAVLNASTFNGNTSGAVSVTSNASSLIAAGNSPTSVNNIASSAIVGTATNDNAAAGFVGEYVESVIASGSAVSLVSGTPKDVTTISLAAGDWDVEFIPGFTGGGTTTVNYLTGSISQTANALDQTNGRFVSMPWFAATVFNQVPAGLFEYPGFTVRKSLNATTTIRAVAQASFATSTCSAFGILRARRVR